MANTSKVWSPFCSGGSGTRGEVHVKGSPVSKRQVNVAVGSSEENEKLGVDVSTGSGGSESKRVSGAVVSIVKLLEVADASLPYLSIAFTVNVCGPSSTFAAG